MVADLLIFIITGLAAGFISGLMGVGGGIVMTPVLHYVVGYEWSTAVALSLFAIALQSPLGLWRHYRKGAVDWRVAAPLVIAGAAGVVIGAWLEPRVSVVLLKRTFAAVMVLAAWRLTRPTVTCPDGGRPSWVLGAAAGLAAGTISRLLGIGGGIVTVPMLALAGVATHIAVGSSLLPVFSNAAVATAGNAGRDLPWLGGLILAAAALAGAYAGVEAAHKVPERGLRRVVAGGLVVAAGYIMLG